MSLVVATPVGGAEMWSAAVSCGYSESLRALSHEMPIETVVDFADDVVRARNRAAALILKNFPAMTHTLWWDSDEWPEDRRIVAEMMASGEDLVAAPYTNKRPPVRWVHQPLAPPPAPVGGMQEVRSVGFGFTMTSRSCLERMTKAARKYRDWPNADVVANIFGMLFEPVDTKSEFYVPEEDEMLLSEDRSFCQRWRALGGKVNVYIKSGVIYHAGSRGWSARDIPGAVLG